MLYYSANLSQLYNKKPLAERMKIVSEAGFVNYELLFPTRENYSELAENHAKYNLFLSLFDLDVDAENPRGHLCLESDKLFLYRMEESLKLAEKTGTKYLNALVGLAQPGVSEAEHVKRIVAKLKKGGEMCKSAGIMLLIEALNKYDAPGYFLVSSSLGTQITDEVGSPNVLFQYDYYHMQMMEGNLIQTVRKLYSKIGHYQIADVPGRHEPGTGEINYPNVLADLAAQGYDAYVGLEYVESSAPDPFAWLPKADRARRKPVAK